MSQVSFENRTVIVTGAGNGLGKAYALDLGSRGANVVVNDLGGAVDGSGSGNTPADERQPIVEKFQDPDSKLRFFVGQPRTGGYGLTLTEAKTVIYYSNGYDLEVRLQSEDRAHRIGQTNKVTYIDIVTEKTVDEKVLRALRSKIDISSRVLAEGYKEWII